MPEPPSPRNSACRECAGRKFRYDLWSNAVTLRAMVADPDVTTVTFGLKNGEAWQDMAGTTDGSGYYTATYKPEWTESTNDAGLTVYTPAAGTA